MKKFLSLAAALFIAFAANATIRPITPTHCFEGDRADGYTLYVEIARGAQAGDTIELADGEYIEPLTMTIDKNIVVMAAENAHPVLKMSGYFDLYASAVFIGIKFDHTDVISNSYGFYVRENTSKSLTLEGCEFTGFDKYCVTGSQSSGHCDAVIANNCYFHDCNNGPFYFPNSSLADGVNMCNHLEVTNSTFANINVQGWVSAIDLRNNGNSTAATSKLIVDHCTFYNCQGDYERLIQSYKSPDAHITNCIMMNPVIEGKTEIYATYLYGGEIHHNLNYQTKRQYGSGVTVTDSIQRDPQFVDAANANYTLAATSPAIGAGTNGSNLGDPRWWPAVAMRTLYLAPMQGWFNDQARFAIYTIDDQKWYDMSLATGETAIYSVEIPEAITQVIFCRMNGGAAENNWTNKWNQTQDMTIEADKNMCTITDWNAGVWSVYGAPYVPQHEDGYYLVGKFGANEIWSVSDDKKMALNTEAEGVEYTIQITLVEGDELKVVKSENDAVTWYPATGGNYVIDANHAGEKTVYFRPNADGGEGWFSGYIYVPENVADGIDNTAVKATVVKTIENGQLIIIKNGVRYNAQGAVVE